MQASRFNLWVKDYPQPGDCLLFNTRTQALIRLQEDFRKDLEDALANPGQIPPRIKENLPALKNNGIIVEDAAEEEEKLKDFFRQIRFSCAGELLKATVLTTYACNFKCVYCFEESVKEPEFLDAETTDAIIRWLILRAQERKVKQVYLVFYGGEPLLNFEPIYEIASKMQAWAKKDKVAFKFSIVTNGSLIRPELVDELLDFGLDELRVTVDGPKEIHDRMRPFLNGQGSFELIMRNIRQVIDKVNIGLAGNFNRQTYSGIYALLDYLEEQGLLKRLSSVGFSPIVPRLGPKQRPQAIELSECASFIGKDGLFNEILSIKKDLLRRGRKVSSGLAINACALFMRDVSVTIDPEGRLYLCNSLLGYPEFSVGDVFSDGFNSTYAQFSGLKAWEKCPQDCVYLPMCQGGCRFFSFVEHNNFEDVACKRDYYDRIIPELIKLEYQSLQKDEI